MKRHTLILLLLCTLGVNAQSIKFDSLALRLPTMLEGDTVAQRLTFRFINTGSESLVIAKVWPTCGCTKVLHSPVQAIKPGKGDSIVVQYKSDRGPGTIDEPVFIYSSKDDLNPIAKLHVLGEVKAIADTQWRHLPKTMGQLRLKRKELLFNESDVVMRIPCANTGPAPLQLKTTLLPPYTTMSTDPQVIKPQQEADIVVRIDRSKLPAIRPVKAAIILEGVPCDISERRITLTIK